MAWSTTIIALALLPVALIAPYPFVPSSANGWLVLFGVAPHPARDGDALRMVTLRRGGGSGAIHRRAIVLAGIWSRRKRADSPSPALPKKAGGK
jgi:hypothetical protein